jgi:chromate transporter
MKKENKKISLFATFFKIGLFTFGGGYAMISLMQKEVVENRKWITEDDMSDMIVISESTPGPVSVNVATFVGYRVAGVFGALCATLGVIVPSILIISLLYPVLGMLQENVIFQSAFFGIRAAVIALILKTFINMFKKTPKDIFSISIMALAFITTFLFGIDAIYLILVAALAGVLYSYSFLGKEKK